VALLCCPFGYFFFWCKIVYFTEKLSKISDHFITRTPKPWTKSDCFSQNEDSWAAKKKQKIANIYILITVIFIILLFSRMSFWQDDSRAGFYVVRRSGTAIRRHVLHQMRVCSGKFIYLFFPRNCLTVSRTKKRKCSENSISLWKSPTIFYC
jgi:hypothetical protein